MSTFSPPPVPPEHATLDRVSEALRSVGFVRCEGLFPGALLDALREEGLSHAEGGRLKAAATGRGAGRALGVVRGDSTLWLDDPRCGQASGAFLASLEALRASLNERLLLGLAEVEAHFALYPLGAGYARHLDRFRDDDARVLSLVCYLNPCWPPGAGGELRITLPGRHVDVPPELGTTVLFLSAEVEHEVLPATQPRLSIAAWFRRRAA